jgi:hypothetical protein
MGFVPWLAGTRQPGSNYGICWDHLALLVSSVRLTCAIIPCTLVVCSRPYCIPSSLWLSWTQRRASFNVFKPRHRVCLFPSILNTSGRVIPRPRPASLPYQHVLEHPRFWKGTAGNASPRVTLEFKAMREVMVVTLQ